MDRKIVLGYGASIILGIAAGMWLSNRKKKSEVPVAPVVPATTDETQAAAGHPLSIDQAMNQAASQPPARPQVRQQVRQQQKRQPERTVVRNNRYAIEMKQSGDVSNAWNNW